MDAVMRMLRRILAYAGHKALVEDIPAKHVVNLAQCPLHIGLLRCQLVGQQQDIPLGYGILGGSPGIFILLEGAVKAILADGLHNLVSIAYESCLHLCPELRICLGGLGIAELRQCQGIIPGKEARLLGDDILLLRHEILLIFLVSGSAEQLRCQPAALGGIRSIVIRAGTAFLSLIHPVDGLLLLGKICPCLLGILQAVLGKCLVNVSIHPAIAMEAPYIAVLAVQVLYR